MEDAGRMMDDGRWYDGRWTTMVAGAARVLLLPPPPQLNLSRLTSSWRTILLNGRMTCLCKLCVVAPEQLQHKKATLSVALGLYLTYHTLPY